jgi:methyl-accepting chemotaxis protein
VIGQLAASMRESSQAVQQIAASAHQQSTAMDQIAQAMREINQAAMQSVASARQSQTAAEGLNNLARQLQTLVARYKLKARSSFETDSAKYDEVPLLWGASPQHPA